MKKRDHIENAYHFFCEAEEHNKSFTIEDICEATNWQRSTVIAYLSKKWHPFLVSEDGRYLCKGICEITLDIFCKIHSQRASLDKDIFRPRFSTIIDMLLDKSRDSALLAIRVYNNPTAVFRTYSFIVHIVISYTALFHAIFEREGIEYWYLDKKTGEPCIVDGDKRYWELETCIEKHYKGSFPETENLRLLAHLRNKIEHRIISSIDLITSGYCQAALINYEDLLVKEFGNYFSLSDSLFLALQISQFSSEHLRTIRKMQATYYQDIKEYIEQYCINLPDAIVQSQNFCFRVFMIPKIGNHAKSSDMALEYIKYDPNDLNEMDLYEKHVALIKERIIQVADQGKMRATDVAAAVSKKTGIPFSVQLHTRAWQYFRIRTSANIEKPQSHNPEYCQFSEPFRSFVYTEKWVSFLSDKVKNEEELANIKAINLRKKPDQ